MHTICMDLGVGVGMGVGEDVHMRAGDLVAIFETQLTLRTVSMTALAGSFS